MQKSKEGKLNELCPFKDSRPFRTFGSLIRNLTDFITCFVAILLLNAEL